MTKRTTGNFAAIAVAGILVTGCAAKPSPPAVELRTITKTVEIQRPCAVTRPVRPAPIAKPYPTDALQLAAFIAAKLAEWSGPGGYGDRADAAITTCTKP